jgi:hypothetical protein
VRASFPAHGSSRDVTSGSHRVPLLLFLFLPCTECPTPLRGGILTRTTPRTAEASLVPSPLALGWVNLYQGGKNLNSAGYHSRLIWLGPIVGRPSSLECPGTLPFWSEGVIRHPQVGWLSPEARFGTRSPLAVGCPFLTLGQGLRIRCVCSSACSRGGGLPCFGLVGWIHPTPGLPLHLDFVPPFRGLSLYPSPLQSRVGFRRFPLPAGRYGTTQSMFDGKSSSSRRIHRLQPRPAPGAIGPSLTHFTVVWTSSPGCYYQVGWSPTGLPCSAGRPPTAFRAALCPGCPLSTRPRHLVERGPDSSPDFRPRGSGPFLRGFRWPFSFLARGCLSLACTYPSRPYYISAWASHPRLTTDARHGGEGRCGSSCGSPCSLSSRRPHCAQQLSRRTPRLPRVRAGVGYPPPSVGPPTTLGCFTLGHQGFLSRLSARLKSARFRVEVRWDLPY